MSLNQRFPPIMLAMSAQLAGVVTGLIVWRVIYGEPNLSLEAFLFPVIAAGVCAALVGKFLLHLPNWWLPINAGFIPAIILAKALNLPGWIYLIAFTLTLAVFWNVRSERVPLYLSNPTTWRALSTLLPEKPGARFVDLGSGIAGTLRYLARQHPERSFVGVESAPIPLLISKLRQLIDPVPNLRIIRKNIWDVDLSEFDVVYCFLSPAPMARLYEKAAREMQPGSRLVSNSFEVLDQPPDEVRDLDDNRRTRLLIWRF